MKSHTFVSLAALTLAFAALPACTASTGREKTGQGLSAASTHIKLADVAVVGSLAYGQTSDPTFYTSTPAYRAFKFAGAAGDKVDVWVRSHDGDAVAYLLDNDLHVVAMNDDADGTTTDAHIVATLPKNTSATHYIVFTEYDRQNANFTVALQGTPIVPAGDYFTCNVDDDCVAVPAVGCCHNGTLAAVNKGRVDAYEASFTCDNPAPICPHNMVDDTRQPECNRTTKSCEMVAIGDIKCGGFIANAHKCPDAYFCDYSGHVPDVPGKCVTQCGHNYVCPNTQSWDEAACKCVANPTCNWDADCSSTDFPGGCSADGVCLR